MKIPCLRGLSERACTMSSARTAGKRVSRRPCHPWRQPYSQPADVSFSNPDCGSCRRRGLFWLDGGGRAAFRRDNGLCARQPGSIFLAKSQSRRLLDSRFLVSPAHHGRRRGRYDPLLAAMSTPQASRSGRAVLCHDRVQKAGQVVGDVIDMRLVAAGKLPFLAKDFARADRHDQDRRHAARVRHFEIAR